MGVRGKNRRGTRNRTKMRARKEMEMKEEKKSIE
jgi:hypothetical protein